MGFWRDSLLSLLPDRKSITQHAVIPTWQDGQPALQPTSYERFSREAVARNEVVFACIEQLSTSAAEPRLKAYRMPAKPGGEPISVDDHPLLDLLEHPNPFLSRTMLWQITMMHRSVAGNVFVEKVRTRLGMEGGQLWLWRPDRVKIIPDAKTYVAGYQVQIGPDVFELPATDVIHFKNKAPLDDFYGMPPLQPAANRVDTDNYMREFTRQFFTNAGVPAGLLTVKQKFNQQDRELLRARFRQDYAGPSGWHNLMIIEGQEASYQQLGMPLGDRGLALSALDDIVTSRIAACFGVPLSLLGVKLGQASSSYANRVADQKTFWEITLIPILREFAATLNTYLVPEFDGIDYVEFDLTDVKALEEDRNEKETRLLNAFKSGAIGRMQFRDLAGYGEPDDDDAYLQPIASTEVPVKGAPAPQPAVAAPGQLPAGQPATVPGQNIGAGQQAQPQGGIGAGEGAGGKTRDADEVKDRGAQTRATGLHKTGGAVLAMLPADLSQRVLDLAQTIPDDDLAREGREKDPHITLVSGFHDTSSADAVRACLARFAPFPVTLGATEVFPASDTPSGNDVLILPVDSDRLKELHDALVLALSFTDARPDYHPHVTVAWLPPGTGKQYAGSNALAGVAVTISDVQFSAGGNADPVTIPLGGASSQPAKTSRLVVAAPSSNGRH